MERIIRNANIWDLHIHTPIGTPTKRNYNNASSEDFVNAILEILNASEYPVGMISFTDHNKINTEVYELFMKRSNIAIIPGVEVDIYLSENDKYSKHIIFYFDENELYNIHELKQLIEGYIDNRDKVIFEDFVMLLINHKKHFAISPHAFKQDKRGIDSDWFDEERAAKGTNEFTGLIFPFWEASGKTEICKAIEFLNMQYNDRENKQAVIAFSDSADYKKLRNYLKSPYQYFNCLNSFKGLLLAGSDPERIIYSEETRPNQYPSDKIKKVTISNNLQRVNKKNKIEIDFSDRLNVIIGGRGKGKSALLDSIVYSLDPSKIEIQERRDFVKKFHADVINFNDIKMSTDVKFLYYSQSYIGKLFDGESQTKLELFFEKEFEHNKEISNGKAELHVEMEKTIKHEVYEDVNIMDDFINFNKTTEEKVLPDVRIIRFENIPLNVNESNYSNVIKKSIPRCNEIWDEQLECLLNEFVRVLLKKICNSNYKKTIDSSFAKIMKDKIEDRKQAKSKELKNKINSKNKIEQKLKFLYDEEIKRIRQINKLYSINKNLTNIKMKTYVANGEGSNHFYFVSISNKEHPVEYARRIIVESVDKRKIKNFDKKSNYEIFMMYATSSNIIGNLRDSMEFTELVNRITELSDIKSDIIHKIIYTHNGVFTDLHKSSPGMQTNCVMEYIMHTESNIPLLIDQPEDNIDNEARFSQLTKWIRQQKYKRQIILVTHDANIVINGDAENVIIAEHTADKFAYEYGALEYGEILDKAAVILDGGKTAIHRRIEKYGE